MIPLLAQEEDSPCQGTYSLFTLCCGCSQNYRVAPSLYISQITLTSVIPLFKASINKQCPINNIFAYLHSIMSSVILRKINYWFSYHLSFPHRPFIHSDTQVYVCLCMQMLCTFVYVNVMYVCVCKCYVRLCM